MIPFVRVAYERTYLPHHRATLCQLLSGPWSIVARMKDETREAMAKEWSGDEKQGWVALIRRATVGR